MGARMSRSRKREAPLTDTCRVDGCDHATTGRKPYCLDHIDRLPYVASVESEIARREAEVKVAETRRGWRKLDASGAAAREIVHELAVKGPQSPGRLAKTVEVVKGALEGYVSALESAGVVKRVETKRSRGRVLTLVTLVEGAA